MLVHAVVDEFSIAQIQSGQFNALGRIETVPKVGELREKLLWLAGQHQPTFTLRGHYSMSDKAVEQRSNVGEWNFDSSIEDVVVLVHFLGLTF